MKIYTIYWTDAENNCKYAKVAASNVQKAIDYASTKGATLESINTLHTDELDVIE